MSDRSQNFIEYIISKVNNNNGNKAALKKASNSNTEFYSWDILIGFGVKLDNDNERLPFALIASDIAKVNPIANGKVKLGKAIALCYGENGSENDQAKYKLRRLLACDTTYEVCLILRSLLSLILSNANIVLDYAELLDQLCWFGNEKSRNLTRIKWTKDFYGKNMKDLANE